MDNLRRFPPPWTIEERKDGFEVKEASGFSSVRPAPRGIAPQWPPVRALVSLARGGEADCQGNLPLARAAEASAILTASLAVRQTFGLTAKIQPQNRDCGCVWNGPRPRKFEDSLC